MNTTAELIMPFGTYETISEGKSGIDRARGVKRLDDQDGRVRMQLEPGSYQFEVVVEPEDIMEASGLRL